MFIRSRTGVQLTEEGQYLLEQATKVFQLLNTTKMHFEKSAAQNIIHMALLSGSKAIFKDKLPAHYQQYEIQYHESDEDGIMVGLQSGEYDMAVSSRPHTDCNCFTKLLDREPLVLCVNKSHPLAQADGWDVQDLDEQTVLSISYLQQSYEPLMQQIVSHGINLLAHQQVFSPFTALEICAENGGVFPLPQALAARLIHPDVKQLCPQNVRLACNYYFITKNQVIKDISADTLHQYFAVVKKRS